MARLLWPCTLEYPRPDDWPIAFHNAFVTKPSRIWLDAEVVVTEAYLLRVYWELRIRNISARARSLRALLDPTLGRADAEVQLRTALRTLYGVTKLVEVDIVQRTDYMGLGGERLNPESRF